MVASSVINFDNASHTQVDARVLAEFCRVEQDFTGNALAQHHAGRAAMQELVRASSGIAELMGTEDTEVIFTSGASEANNLAIKGIARAYAHVGKHILTTCLEHPSVSGTLASLSQAGYEIELLRIRENGQIDMAHMASRIRRDTLMVCVSAVDSELGVIQPLEEIAAIIASFPQCHLHVDGAQAVGKVNAPVLGSTYCFSPHKFHGIAGVGVLLRRNSVVLEPLVHGGASTSIYRSGTPALGLSVSSFTALALAMEGQAARYSHVSNLYGYVSNNLAAMPGLSINTPQGSSPYILNLSAAGVRGTAFQAMLDQRGILVSVKSACSSGNAPSRAVMATTNNKKRATEAWRISFSHLNTMREAEIFLQAVQACYKGE